MIQMAAPFKIKEIFSVFGNLLSPAFKKLRRPMKESEPHLLRKDYNLTFDSKTKEFVVKFNNDWFRTDNGMDVIRYILRKQEIRFQTNKILNNCDWF